VRKGKGKR